MSSDLYGSPPELRGQLSAALGNDSNSYQVVVQASDGGMDSHVNWFKVTVNVTDVEESGTVAEWTVDADSEWYPAEVPSQKLLQFNASATLTVVDPDRW